MNCLRVDQVYLYLEEELPLSKKNRVKEHLSSCSKCRDAVEERRRLLQASESLSLWEAPPDFTHQVMARLFPVRMSIRKWIAVTAAGFALMAFVFLAYIMFSGQTLVSSLSSIGLRSLNLLRSVSVFLLKIVKLIGLLIRVIVQIFEIFIQFLARLTAMISPEVQIVLIILTVILSTSLLFGVRRKLLTGDKA